MIIDFEKKISLVTEAKDKAKILYDFIITNYPDLKNTVDGNYADFEKAFITYALSNGTKDFEIEIKKKEKIMIIK